VTVTSPSAAVDPYQPAHADAASRAMRSASPTPARGATRVVLERDLSPFDRLEPGARRRLLVRVLCGLVAYDAPDEPAAPERLAG
jgi:hypothetical protein